MLSETWTLKLFRGIHPGVGLVLRGSFFQSRRDIFKMADAVHVPLKSNSWIHLSDGLWYQPPSEFRAGFYPTKSRCLSYRLVLRKQYKESPCCVWRSLEVYLNIEGSLKQHCKNMASTCFTTMLEKTWITTGYAAKNLYPVDSVFSRCELIIDHHACGIKKRSPFFSSNRQPLFYLSDVQIERPVHPHH